jgi:hypothetical protein
VLCTLAAYRLRPLSVPGDPTAGHRPRAGRSS